MAVLSVNATVADAAEMSHPPAATPPSSMRCAGAMRLRNAFALSTLSGNARADLDELGDVPPAELAHVRDDWQVWARDDQLPPEPDDPAAPWRVWVILGGRGAGKTRAGAEWVRAMALGEPPFAREPAGRIALVGETLNDVRRVMIEGVSGLLSVHRDHERPHFEASKLQLTWPNGTVAQMFSAENPDSLRGPQFAAAWCDELAKWRNPETTWNMLQFGLRLGTHPQVTVTTTPRPIPLLKALLADATTVLTRSSTIDNAKNLSPGFVAEMTRRYAGTALGRQELLGEIVDDVSGALWRREWIANQRVTSKPDLAHVVVAVDPPVTSTVDSDACGIVVAGVSEAGHAYVIADRTVQGREPHAWARAVVATYHEFLADRVVAEVNQGGDLVVSVLRQIDPAVAVRKVHATRGKWLRAEPIAALYGGRMVDTTRIHVYAWDARPYPAFPFDTDLWIDGDNWRFGHWLNGRLTGVPLDSAVGTILTDFGFDAFDTSGINGMVQGFVIDRVMSAREAMQPLELAYFYDALESGSKVVFRHRGSEPAIRSFSQGELVEAKPESPLLTLARGQETELPAQAKVTFIRSDGDYRQAVVEARRLAGASGRVAQAELPIVLEAERAGAIAESWLYETWSARERAAFALPPSALALEPGDVVTVTNDGVDHLIAIREISDHGARDVEGRSVDPPVYAAVTVPGRKVEGTAPITTGAPEFEFLDLPLLRGDERPEQGYVAAAKEPWPGSIAVYGSPTVAGFTLKGVAPFASVLGETLDPFPPGAVSVVDRATRCRVEIGAGELASVTEAALFAGANTAAIRDASGQWEVIQYQTAALVAARTYELSGLLRAQGGTEAAMSATLPVGTRVVFLSEALAPVDISLAEMRLPLNWRVGPAIYDIGHSSYVASTYAFQGIGLRPLSPVHVRGARASGDLALSWVRRTRVGGDNWELPDVPVAEEQERYEIDILDGATVKRTLTATTTSATYTAAEQTADFGAPQTNIAVTIHQMSAAYGRGTPARATI